MPFKNIRKSILHMAHYSKSSHVGSCLSIADILYTLYFKVLNVDPCNPQKYDRDKFILSKGHGSAVAEVIAESGKSISFRRIGIPDVYSHYVGSQQFLREQFICKPTI